MVSRLRGAYPQFNRDVQGEEYMGAIKRMESEFGRERTSEAITKAIDLGGGRDRAWLPTIAEIRGLVPPKSGERRRCEKCANSEGFEYVEVEIRGQKQMRARHCTHVG